MESDGRVQLEREVGGLTGGYGLYGRRDKGTVWPVKRGGLQLTELERKAIAPCSPSW